jgi:hypothetical protein
MSVAARTAKTFWSLPHGECLAHVRRAYEEEGRIGQTVRHYYYKLLSSGAIRLTTHPKTAKNAYSYVSRLLTDARRADILGWDAVIDPGRRAFIHWAHESLAECIRLNSRAIYRAPIWRGQPRRLEVWVEKDGLAEFADRVVRPYRVPVHVAKGYGSATVIKEAAERYGRGVGWTLLYAGDFDPSGLDIQRSLRDTLREHGARPEIVRVGLTLEDTRDLPAAAALPLKRDDSRTAGFVEMYGPTQRGYEIEALPIHTLRDKLAEAVTSRMDVDELQRALQFERDLADHLGQSLAAAFAHVEEGIFALGLGDWGDEMIRRYLHPPE